MACKAISKAFGEGPWGAYEWWLILSFLEVHNKEVTSLPVLWQVRLASFI
jgi:hypothetical protein